MANFTNLLCALLLFLSTYSLPAQIGNTAPDFTVTDVHGNTHHLYDYLDSGKYVVLDFFFTTCGPCQFYSPQVNLAFEKYGCNNAQVLFMAIDYDDSDAEVLAYDEEYGIEYPSVSGNNGGGNAVVSQYGVFGFPTFYLIDSTRTIIDVVDPPTLQVFDFRFGMHGILPASCSLSHVEESSQPGYLPVFPNPAGTGSVSLDLSTISGHDINIQVLDVTGKTVLSYHLENSGDKTYTFSTNGCLPGQYFLKVTNNSGIYFTRLVVQ